MKVQRNLPSRHVKLNFRAELKVPKSDQCLECRKPFKQNEVRFHFGAIRADLCKPCYLKKLR